MKKISTDIQDTTTMEKVNKTKSWFFKRSIKYWLFRLTKNKGEKAHITDIRNKRGDIITDPAENKRKMENILNKFVPTNSKTYMKGNIFLTDTTYQDSLQKIDN